MSIGVLWMGDDGGSSVASNSSEDRESTLAESSGTSLRPGLNLAMSIAGVVVNCGCVSQQRVSRFHMRQLKFSSLRPFSIDSAHFEKTGPRVSRSLIVFVMPCHAHHSTCQKDSPHSECRHRASSPDRPTTSGFLT